MRKDGRDDALRTLILAAGKGKRMMSDLAKVLHTLGGKPLLAHVIDTAQQLGSKRIVVVIGHQAGRIRQLFGAEDVAFVEQHEQLGTGHAVLQARDAFAGYGGTVLILCGDVPLLSLSTLRNLIRLHVREKAAVTVLTTILADPGGYGRVVKDGQGGVLRIVEDRDATAKEKEIREINTGIYCVEAEFLFPALERITDANAQREYYLTDIIDIARREGQIVRALVAPDAEETMGINTPQDLDRAARHLSGREKKIDGVRHRE